MNNAATRLGKAINAIREKGMMHIIRYITEEIDKATGIPSLLLAPYASRLLKRVTSLDETINFLFSDNIVATLIRPMQVLEEIERFAEIVAVHKPKTILEIGTARGGTLFLWTRVASPDALIISIDLPGGLFGGGYPRLKTILYKKFAYYSQKIVLIRADSHSKLTFEKVKAILGNRPLDFLFIDGDHRYEGVKKDYNVLQPCSARRNHSVSRHSPRS